MISMQNLGVETLLALLSSMTNKFRVDIIATRHSQLRIQGSSEEIEHMKKMLVALSDFTFNVRFYADDHNFKFDENSFSEIDLEGSDEYIASLSSSGVQSILLQALLKNTPHTSKELSEIIGCSTSHFSNVLNPDKNRQLGKNFLLKIVEKFPLSERARRIIRERAR